ncbi:MAG: ATP-binding protein [Pseudomonadota bacterium]
MILAVASGKGGTGKTTLAVNLAKVFGAKVGLFDCDVEEPNADLFLKGKLLTREVASISIPEVDEALCDACGECGRFCQFNAIVSLQSSPLVFPELCHGCGGCTLVCPQKAIKETDQRIGVVETLDVGDGVTLVQGRLDVGVAMAPPLIRAVKARLGDETDAILDAPPGTSCPVIATIRGADAVILVTEPTPFGLYDLILAVEMVRELGRPFGVVINRVGSGDGRVHDYCHREKIDILLELPDDRRIAEAYSRGRLIVEALPEYRVDFEGLLVKLRELARAGGPNLASKEGKMNNEQTRPA